MLGVDGQTDRICDKRPGARRVRLDACWLGCGDARGTKGGHRAASAAAEGKIERLFRTTETGLETPREDNLLFVGQDVFETGPISPVPNRGDVPEGEPAVRKPRGYDLDTARREAPGPWRIGGGDDAGIHVLDANGERVATIWKTPSRSVSALEAIQALVVRMGDEVLATRLCANPECRRPFDAPSRTQKLCECRVRGKRWLCGGGERRQISTSVRGSWIESACLLLTD